MNSAAARKAGSAFPSFLIFSISLRHTLAPLCRVAAHLLLACGWCYFSLRCALPEEARPGGGVQGGGGQDVGPHSTPELRFQEGVEFSDGQVQGKSAQSRRGGSAEPAQALAGSGGRCSSAHQDPGEAWGRARIPAEECGWFCGGQVLQVSGGGACRLCLHLVTLAAPWKVTRKQGICLGEADPQRGRHLTGRT